MNSLSATAVLLLLIPWVSAQVTQSASDGSSQFRFVAQLNVSGCTLFLHDTGANDGPHLAVEPIMCVKRLQNATPRYDPVTQQTYVSVPVMLRDDAMLVEVQSQLRHLSPKSVKFTTVSDISVSTDNSSKFQAYGFIWSPEDPVGFLRLGCESSLKSCSICNFGSGFQVSMSNALEHVTLSATAISNDTTLQLNYRLTIQNSSFTDSDFDTGRFRCLQQCEQLRFIRSIRLINCTARVHQRLDMKGHFLIEPLLCHNISSMSNEPIMYDYSRDMYYLKLDVVLQDDMTVDAVRTQLADLSPHSVAFMRLWRAQRHVASALSSRFEIGPLMVSGDWRSAHLRVYCRTEDECKLLRSAVFTEPVDLWNHVKYSVTSLVTDTSDVSGRCILKSDVFKHPWIMQESGGPLTDVNCSAALGGPCAVGFPCRTVLPTTTSVPESWRNKIIVLREERKFIKIQQRLTGSVSFQRRWAEYEKGFGDDTDFWIGLSAIHSLSMNGTTLRVEMKLHWDGTERHAEYAGFKVGDASTNYTMTYREMLKDRSSVRYDAMEFHKGMQFSTMDRDNDRHNYRFCSQKNGNAGWWFFSGCIGTNPNGKYPRKEKSFYMEECSWSTRSGTASLREVRLMLQI